jgi:hypothetical protein
LPALNAPPIDRAAVATALERDGFAVIQFPEPDLDRMAEEIRQSLDPCYEWDDYRGGKTAGLRVENAWKTNDNVRRIAANPTIIDLLAGPLIYYPGSHKWPVILPETVNAPRASGNNPYENYHLLEKAWEAEIAARGTEPMAFLAKKGEALIWDANLWHGGAPQTDRSLTRHSQVTHYFFEGCTYWAPLTGEERHPVPIGPPAVAPPARSRFRLLDWFRR